MYLFEDPPRQIFHSFLFIIQVLFYFLSPQRVPFQYTPYLVCIYQRDFLFHFYCNFLFHRLQLIPHHLKINLIKFVIVFTYVSGM